MYISEAIDYCSSSPCRNGSTCSNLVVTYSCRCSMGYTGVNCESIIPTACDSSPCLNGTCAGSGFDYTCNCSAGFTGLQCETEIAECESSPCLHDSTCLEAINSYSCRCDGGYTGLHCETFTETTTGIYI